MKAENWSQIGKTVASQSAWSQHHMKKDNIAYRINKKKKQIDSQTASER